jgi:membrane-associated phospholipid phosphatase
MIGTNKNARLYKLGVIILSVLICYSRIVLKYHTLEQVIMGALLGFVISSACLRFGFTKLKEA